MNLIDIFLNLLYPPKCPFCMKLLRDKNDCICPKCKKDLPYTKNGGKLNGNFFTVCISPLYYEGDVRESLLRYKFGRLTAYANPYGQLLAECIEEYLDAQVDMISWVPLSRKRLRDRGYDQARLLAEAVSFRLGIPCKPLLKKIRNTAPQSRTGSAEKRKANISEAYKVIDSEKVSGKTILLIDDIVTTGTTLSECSRMLGMAGAERIYCAAVARKM